MSQSELRGTEGGFMLRFVLVVGAAVVSPAWFRSPGAEGLGLFCHHGQDQCH